MKVKINKELKERQNKDIILSKYKGVDILISNKKNKFYKTFNKIESILDRYNLEYTYIKKSNGVIYIKELDTSIWFFWSTFGGGFVFEEQYFYFDLEKLEEYLNNKKQFIFYKKLNQSLKVNNNIKKKVSKI